MPEPETKPPEPTKCWVGTVYLGLATKIRRKDKCANEQEAIDCTWDRISDPDQIEIAVEAQGSVQ
jgi:hypothetical protein